MKKTLLRMFAIAILALTANLVMAQTYTFPVKGQQGFTLTEKTRGGAHINYELGQFSLSQINYRGEEMSEISINALNIPNDAGKPNLPVESRLIAIPQGATPILNVIRAKTETFQNVNIAPALRIQAENEEPEMNYEKDKKIYSRNAFYPETPFTMGRTIIRGVDAVNVAITPFQYNPVTKELVVYTDIELSLTYEGGNDHFGDDRLRSPYWDPILAGQLMNYDQLPVIDYEARMQQWLRDGDEGAEYVIVIPNNDSFLEPALSLKEYRTKQGIITQVVRLDEMPASTTDQMKSWFHNAYNTWDIAPVAVLLFGDHNTNMAQGIPAITVSHPYSGTCITDNQYADVTGDHLPEMIFCRLVAANGTEAAMMANKQIDYEYTNPTTDPNFYTSPITALGWQTERWFQLCSEVFGGYMRAHGYTPQRINCIYSGTPGNSWSSAQNTDQVIDYFGPNGTNYIPATPSQLGGWTGGSPEQVVNAVNAGTFWVQHRDHGLDEGWGEPAVRNEHIDQLTNANKMPFVMSINCQTGMFNYTGSNGNCFTEKWMRRTYNGQNAGAVGVLSPTEVSYSFVNDAFVWGVYDHFDPNFMPTLPNNTNTPAYEHRGNWRPAFGNVAGKYFLQETSWPYNTDDKQITYIMFTAHCDAFLRIYTQVPQTMTVNHQNVQLAGLGTFQITAPEGTTIALTKGEGENLEVVAVAQGTGTAQNVNIAPQVPPTILHLTVTGQNYFRYEADIEVIPADGPYIVINEFALSNQVSQLNYGETNSLDIRLKNVGSSQAPAGTMTITSESEYVTFTNNTASFDAINANSTLDISEAFSFTISDEVPNKTGIEFTIIITSGDDTYESRITLKAYAPILEIGDIFINEINGNGNGRLDPGETVMFKFPINNIGNAEARAVQATLNINNEYMTILTEPTVTIDTIQAGIKGYAEYQVFIGAAPAGCYADFSLYAAAGAYTDTKDFVERIGLNVEDFEKGEIDPAWTNDASHPWTCVTEEPYEGHFCAKSGSIGSNQNTTLSFSFTSSEIDTISFFYKVSSEGTYDKMYFYIDDVEKGHWSGNVAWTNAQYRVLAGRHTYTWKYEKDGSVNSGSDCCWIDYVILPRDTRLTCSAGLDVDICEGSTAQINGIVTNQTSLEWTSAGDGTFDDATIVNPVYTPGSQDIANGSVILTLTAYKGDESQSDEMTLTINRHVQIDNALVDNYYCAVSEPQEVAVDITGDYTSFTWTTEGDGTFENANEPSTYYTPGPQDLANGYTSLLASAESVGCGATSYDYPIVFSPMPNYTMGVIPPCVFTVCQGSDYDFTYMGTFEGFIDGLLTMVIDDDTYTIVEGEPFMLLTSALEPGTHTFEFRSISNGICEHELNDYFTIEVLENPMLTVAQESFEICAGETVSFELTATGGEPNQPYTITGDNMEPITFTGASYTLELTPAETTEIHLTRIVSGAPNCGDSCEADLDITLTVNVNDLPELTVAEVPASICQGEEVSIVFSFTGEAPFTVEGTGFETFTAEEDSYTMTLTPTEDVDITLTKVVSASGCESTMEENIAIEVKEVADVPEISGAAEVDVRITPTSTYTIGNDVMVNYTLEPEAAGTISSEINDGKTINITWSETFKGEATLTAMPVAECNNGESTMTIKVKNSTGVGEWANNAKIFPNPTSGKVTIECQGMTRISVFNAMGQHVYDEEVNADSTSIDMSQFPAGSYLVRIITGQGICTKHLNVVR